MAKIGLIVFMVAMMAVALVVEGGCDVESLSPCWAALGGATPSALCCRRLRDEKDCLTCDNLKKYQKYITRNQAERIARACNVPIPEC
ncbi:non-specific lipid-transfer protein 2-like [Andrographis paniculata]|uniref:non-specific lipid-transfer protein 2-like n=1 Tax=Andrographis paniculata TaxID=175694 RepID=UPI0021E92ACD|nr:non-specific lipid-transfer protein 2-like [Andrographis paniculata]